MLGGAAITAKTRAHAKELLEQIGAPSVRRRPVGERGAPLGGASRATRRLVECSRALARTSP